MRFEPVIRRGVIPVLFAALLALPAPPAAAGDVPFGPAVVFDASAADGGDADNHALDDGGTVISVTGDGTFDYTLSGVISGSGDLVKTGDGRLVLGNANNSYSGATIVNDGVLEIVDWNSINANSLRNEVTGSGELRSNGGLSIGNWDTGTLNITNGGTVSAVGDITIGDGSNDFGNSGTGTVTVSGAGSTLSTAGNLLIGHYTGTTGTLNIIDGGKVFAAGVRLENSSGVGSSGTALVGAGSELHLTDDNLAVYNGLLTGGGTISLDGVGNNVTINSGTISVGDHRGQIGELTIQGGDLRNNVGMYLRVDTAEDGSADRITIDGGAFSTTSLNQTKMIIDLSSLNRVVNASVITATGGITGLTPGSVEFTLNGTALNSIARVTGITQVEVVGNQLLLTTSLNAQSEKMTWTGHANGVDTDEWNQTDAKWTNSNDTLHTFLAGDWAVFDGSSSTVLAIDQAVNASRMDVTAGMWVFRGDLTVREEFWVGAPNNEADGKLHVTGNANVRLYGDTLFSGGIEVADDSTLIIEKNNAYQFNDALTGDALLVFRMNGNELSFGTDVGSAFTGTVALNNGDLAIDANAETALSNATLRLDRNGTAVVSESSSLNTLDFNGGTLNMAAFDGSGTVYPNTLLNVDELANSGGGSVTINLNDTNVNGIKTTAADYDTLFNYGNDDSLYQRQIVSANTVDGAIGTLNLTDDSGRSLHSKQAVERGINDGVNGEVGRATFDYTVAVNEDGMFLGYGLTQVEALAGKSVVLDTTGSAGAPMLTAKLTGAGGFVFSGSKDAAVGNTASDYTGATVIDATTVTMLTDNALGKTSGLALANNGRLDMNGKAQTVGGLAGDAGTRIDLGALTVDQAGNSTFSGNLLGAGSLTKDGSGVLTLSGANSYAGDTVISGGTLALNGAGSLGSGRLAMAGGTAFDFSGASAAPSSFARLDVLGAGATILGNGEILDLGGIGKTVAFDLAGVGAGAVMLDTATAQLDVSGAVLELNNLAAVSLTDGQRITLITNVLGDFANPDQYSSRNGRRTFGVERDGASVYLGVTVNSFLSSQNNGNVNLASGADYLDRLDAGGYPVTDLEDMWTPSQALGGRAADIALEQMYGGYAAYANAGLKAAGGRFRSLLQGRIAPDSLSPCFGSGLWASGFGSRVDQNGAENLSGHDWDAQGLALGYEHSFDSRLRAGVGAAYAKGALSVNDLRYENTPDVVNLALYGVYAAPSGFFAQGSLGYGHAWNDYDVTMLLGGEKRGKYGSDGWFANLQLGYAAELPQGYNLIPSVGVEYDRVRNSGWEESVSGNPVLIANRFDSESDDSVALPFGLRFNKLFRFGRRGDQNGGYVVPEVRAAYVYNADAPRSSIGAGYAGAPGSAVMAGVAPGRSLWRLGAGVSGRFNERVDFRVDYDFEARAGYRGHSLTATLGVAF